MADPEPRDHRVLAGPAERITNRRHEVDPVAMLEHKVVDNRSDRPCTGALRRARAAPSDGILPVLGARLLADLEGVQRLLPRRGRSRAPGPVQAGARAGVEVPGRTLAGV